MRISLMNSRDAQGRAAKGRAALAEKGYTLAEVMVGAAILGFVAASLYAAFAAGFCLIQSTRENLRATQIMMQKLEAVRLFTWSQVNDTNYYLKPLFIEPYDPVSASTNANSGGTKYTGFLSAAVPAVGEVPEAYRTNMRTVTVSVYWTNYNGAKRIVQSRAMQTRVARNGMQNYIWGSL
jgi:prepilin-type N-terminal cleavage/methylation domain-containing protein